MASVRYCQKLPSCPKEVREGSRKFGNEAKPGKKGGMGESWFKIQFSHYPTLI